MKDKIKVLFICHGNICRSTMAESYFTYIVSQAGLAESFEIDSAATSREEIGNPPHHGTVRKLESEGIPVIPHRARRMTRDDAAYYDFLIGMDDENIYNMERIAGKAGDGKIFKLLAFAQIKSGPADASGECRLPAGKYKKGASGGHRTIGAVKGKVPDGGYVRDVADPWYTGDFEATYRDIVKGCRGLLRFLI